MESKSLINRTFLIGFILFSYHSFSQKALKITTYACKQQMNKEGKEQILSGSKVNIYDRNNIFLQAVLQNDSGVFVFNLLYNNVYRIEYTCENYVTASSIYNLEGIPDNAPRNISYLAIMFLNKKREKVEYSLFHRPLIKYIYSPELLGIAQDVEYFQIMSSALQVFAKLKSKTKNKKLLIQF